MVSARSIGTFRTLRNGLFTASFVFIFAVTAPVLMAQPGYQSAAKRAVAPPPPLYTAAGPVAGDVLQGNIGSCFFYSTAAAIAYGNPDKLQGAIKDMGAGKYVVTFLDGTTEVVEQEDAMYARRNDFDRSSAFWVAIVFRAYATRTLRKAVLAAIDSADGFSFIKEAAKSYITSNDSLLLAYDRAIREELYQNGSLGAGGLEMALTEQMKTYAIPPVIQKQVLDYAKDKNFLQTIAASINKNGELFGAYRAVGQGGISTNVFAVLSGEPLDAVIDEKSKPEVQAVLSRFRQGKQAIVASTGDTLSPDLVSRYRADGKGLTWWVADHAYTVLDYDDAAATVTLRNPWGDRPAPDGVYTLPFADFLVAFQHLSTTK